MIHRCDQSDPELSQVVSAQIETAFAINDEGSLILEHQLLTWDLFFALFWNLVIFISSAILRCLTGAVELFMDTQRVTDCMSHGHSWP